MKNLLIFLCLFFIAYKYSYSQNENQVYIEKANNGGFWYYDSNVLERRINDSWFANDDTSYIVFIKIEYETPIWDNHYEKYEYAEKIEFQICYYGFKVYHIIRYFTDNSIESYDESEYYGIRSGSMEEILWKRICH